MEAGQVWELVGRRHPHRRMLVVTLYPDPNDGCWVVLDLDDAVEGTVALPRNDRFKATRLAC